MKKSPRLPFAETRGTTMSYGREPQLTCSSFMGRTCASPHSKDCAKDKSSEYYLKYQV